MTYSEKCVHNLRNIVTIICGCQLNIYRLLYQLNAFISYSVTLWLSYLQLDPRLAGSNSAEKDGILRTIKSEAGHSAEK
jgi:hypothetical protein